MGPKLAKLPKFSALLSYVFVIGIFVILMSAPVYAATVTWDGGGGDEECSTSANWDTNSVPGTGDDVVFDATSTKNATIGSGCVSTFRSLSVNSGYTGTVTLALTTLTISDNFSISGAGTFDAQSNTVAVIDNFSVTNGTYKQTGGTLFVQKNFDLGASGTIIGNGAALSFSGGNSHNGIVTYDGNLNADTGFDSITHAKSDGGLSVLTIASDTTVTLSTVNLSSDGNLTISAGGTVIGSSGIWYSGTLTNHGSFTAGSNSFRVTGDASFLGTTNNLNNATSIDIGRTLTVNGATLTVDTNNLTGLFIERDLEIINGGEFDLTGVDLTFDGSCSQNTTIDCSLLAICTSNFNSDTGVGTVTLGKVCEGLSTVTVVTGTTLTAKATNDGFITVQSGATLNGATFGGNGNWFSGKLTNNGSFTAASGTFRADQGVVFKGTTNNLDAATRININNGNLTVDGATLTVDTGNLTGGLLINKDLEIINGGTFDLTDVDLNFNGSCGQHTTVDCSTIASCTDNFNTGTGVKTVTLSKSCEDLSIVTVTNGTTLTAQPTNDGGIIIEVGAALIGADHTPSGGNANWHSGSITNNGSLTVASGTFLADFDCVFNGSTNDLSNSSQATFGRSVTINSGKTFLVSDNPLITGNLTTSGTFDTSNITLSFIGNRDSIITHTSDIKNLIINKGNVTTKFASDATVTGNFTRTTGPIFNSDSAQTLSIKGNLVVNNFNSDNFGGSNLTVKMDGTGAQTLSKSGSGASFLSPLVFNGSNDTIKLASDFPVTTESCTVTGGTLDLDGFNLTCDGGLIVQDGGTLKLIGTESPTSPTLQTGSTVSFKGDGDSGSDTYTINNLTSTYKNLKIDSTDGNTDKFQTNATVNADEVCTNKTGTLFLNGNTMTCAGGLVVQNGAVLQLIGNESATVPTLETGSIVAFVGDNDSNPDTYTVTDLTTNYTNLVIISDDGNTDKFELGTDIDINEDFTLTTGTFDASMSNHNMTVAGDWTNSGQFNAQGGTVTLDSSGTSEIGGNTTFNDLTIATAGKVVKFTAGSTQTVNGDLTLSGAEGNLLVLQSSSNNSEWFISDIGSTSVSFVDVQDSNASGGVTIVANFSTNSGNNTNWRFNIVPNTPTLGPPNLVNGSKGDDNTPTLMVTVSDPDMSDQIQVRYQIDNDSNFISPLVDYTSALSAQGTIDFTVGQATGGGSYATGSQGQILADGSYYWRAQVTDQFGAAGSFVTANSGSVAFIVDTVVFAIQFENTTGSGQESVTNPTVTVVLDNVFGKAVSASYSVTGGTATSADYTLDDGTVTISAGETSAQIPLVITSDGLDEDNETIIITLSNPVNSSLGVNTEFTYTILDDDETSPLIPDDSECNSAPKLMRIPGRVLGKTSDSQLITALLTVKDLIDIFPGEAKIMSLKPSSVTSAIVILLKLSSPEQVIVWLSITAFSLPRLLLPKKISILQVSVEANTISDKPSPFTSPASMRSASKSKSISKSGAVTSNVKSVVNSRAISPLNRSVDGTTAFTSTSSKTNRFKSVSMS